jgi:hypothetical protein
MNAPVNPATLTPGDRVRLRCPCGCEQSRELEFAVSQRKIFTFRIHGRFSIFLDLAKDGTLRDDEGRVVEVLRVE